MSLAIYVEFADKENGVINFLKEHVENITNPTWGEESMFYPSTNNIGIGCDTYIGIDGLMLRTEGFKDLDGKMEYNSYTLHSTIDEEDYHYHNITEEKHRELANIPSATKQHYIEVTCSACFKDFVAGSNYVVNEEGKTVAIPPISNPRDEPFKIEINGSIYNSLSYNLDIVQLTDDNYIPMPILKILTPLAVIEEIGHWISTLKYEGRVCIGESDKVFDPEVMFGAQ